MEQMTAEDARRSFADLLNRVGFKGEQILITRHGKPIAKLVPVTSDETTDRVPPDVDRLEKHLALIRAELADDYLMPDQRSRMEQSVPKIEAQIAEARAAADRDTEK